MSRILIVDDEAVNRDLLERRLGRRGYETVSAADGPAALELVFGDGVDLVLLDIRMPGMDGEEVLRRIRERLSSAELPVIMVTAEAESQSVVSALALGADDYVTKPIDFPVLLARMESKLALTKMVQAQLGQDAAAGAAARDEAAIRSMIEGGEHQQLEFKSSLRWNILAGKMGKEIGIAWTKTLVAFLNSDGGTLLVGVSDDGEILGTELDRFQSDDKYLLHVNNTIKDMIGLEYISHIEFGLCPVGDKKVLCIDVRPYPEAVFLKNGRDEEFYARFGPSSRQLSTREVLSYMQQRR